jgi:hypothetical protein
MPFLAVSISSKAKNLDSPMENSPMKYGKTRSSSALKEEIKEEMALASLFLGIRLAILALPTVSLGYRFLHSGARSELLIRIKIQIAHLISIVRVFESEANILR